MTRAFGLLLTLFLFSAAIDAEPGTSDPLRPAFLNREILFEVHQPPLSPEVRVLARSKSYDLFLSDTGADLRFKNIVVRMSFRGADPQSHLSGMTPSGAVATYFRGSDPRLWRRSLPLYRQAVYSHLYPGIDAAFYGRDGEMEYDFKVAAHADPGKIGVHFQSLVPRLTADGDLVLALPSGELRFRAPLIYQLAGSSRSYVKGGYLIDRDGAIRFQLGDYDPSKELIIDPVISYSTFLGGSDDEGIFGIQRDREGNIYVSGETSSVDFPVNNAYQSIEGGDYDAFVSKFDRSGTHLIYSTYLGGSGYDHAVGLAVNGRGEAFLAGVTRSADFPTANAIQAELKGISNAFITHLASSGSELIFSSYLGGSNSDGGAMDIAIDAASNVFIAGQTNSIDFPTTRGAFQTVCDGPDAFPGTCNSDGFVSKISADGSKLLYSTYLGGDQFDEISGLAVDRDGNAIVTGQTVSANFPVRNAFQPKLAGMANAFLAKVNSTGGQLAFSTYLGGSLFDSGNAVALGPEGVIWIAGITSSQNFPLVQAFQSTISEMNAHTFVSEFTANGASLLRSSYFGGSGFDYPFRIGVDAFGSPSVIGFTTSSDLPVINSVQAHFAGGYSDAFVLKLLPKSFKPLYATYVGGAGDDFGYGLYQEPLGNLWFGGSTSSEGFPIKDGFQTTYAGGPYDAFLTRLSLTAPEYVRIVEDLLGHKSETMATIERNLEHVSAELADEPTLTPQQVAERLCQAVPRP